MQCSLGKSLVVALESFPNLSKPHKPVHGLALLHTWAAGASLAASRVTFQLEGTDFPCGYIRADFCEEFDFECVAGSW